MTAQPGMSIITLTECAHRHELPVARRQQRTSERSAEAVGRRRGYGIEHGFRCGPGERRLGSSPDVNQRRGDVRWLTPQDPI